ncbi:hypothetical protein pb186bvf_000329 [Paramecium bursaria]
MWILLLITIAYSQSEQEAIQYINDLKDQTNARIEALERSYIKIIENKQQAVKELQELKNEQDNECCQKSFIGLQIQNQLDDSQAKIEKYTSQLQKNVQREQKLSEIKCQSNINYIKLLKDQKQITRMSAELSQSFQQNDSSKLMLMIQQEEIQQIQFVKYQLKIEIQLNEEQVPQKQKKLEQNQKQILDISQQLYDSVPQDQQLIQTNQLKSNSRLIKFVQYLKEEDALIQRLIDNEVEKIVDYKDQLIIFQQNDKQCSETVHSIDILIQLIQIDLEREKILYQNSKKELTQQYDTFTDMARTYLKWMYKK